MNLGYTGKPYDTTTGLYNYGYRDYKPEAARFTTVDPVRDGANWFSFVNNDPVNWIDPWGLEANDKSDKKGFWTIVGDIAGKVWAAPMTAIRVLSGAVLTGISVITGHGGGISFENNAITFTTGFNLNGLLPLGIQWTCSRTRLVLSQVSQIWRISAGNPPNLPFFSGSCSITEVNEQH
ncbi:MAG: RHS repeat-associated core domain-containing protein, partial [Treponema sp.]|jgi:RHS repeat-associated protein|nr:RHS repeat-associated core domain-containing protein [Treponema sp.]